MLFLQLTEDKTKLFLWLLFSEELIKYRVLVEIEYFALCEVPLPQLAGVNPIYLIVYETYIKISLLKMRYDQRNRKVTNHDVKAVEYFIKDAFENWILLNTKSSSILD
jgi:adenylosuccinate lyase